MLTILSLFCRCTRDCYYSVVHIKYASLYVCLPEGIARAPKGIHVLRQYIFGCVFIEDNEIGFYIDF